MQVKGEMSKEQLWRLWWRKYLQSVLQCLTCWETFQGSIPYSTGLERWGHACHQTEWPDSIHSTLLMPGAECWPQWMVLISLSPSVFLVLIPFPFPHPSASSFPPFWSHIKLVRSRGIVSVWILHIASLLGATPQKLPWPALAGCPPPRTAPVLCINSHLAFGRGRGATCYFSSFK